MSPICLYREAIRLQCLCACAYALREEWEIPVTYYVDDLYPHCSEQHYSECACIVWLYHAYSYSVGPKKAINL